MSGYTPGPWHTKREGLSTIYVEANIGGGWVQEVAACGPTETADQKEANARLIAAAPELLEALERIAVLYEKDTDADNYEQAANAYEMRCIARAAIAKARGEA
jgi:hypothetical protein